MENPLARWTLQRSDFTFVGEDLCRPECILADKDGHLWAADGRGALTGIAPDGSQIVLPLPGYARQEIGGRLLGNAGACVPNGFTRRGTDFVIADIAMNRFGTLDASGRYETLLDRCAAQPLGAVNFVLADSRDRLWLSISARQTPADQALHPGTQDGYIIMIDEAGPRIVADGFAFTNELRFDAGEEWLYVSESAGKRISRLRATQDGGLSDREVFGPSTLGNGFPDGIAFDAWGNLWVAMIVSERILAITPEGQVMTIFDDGNPPAIARAEAAFLSGGIPGELAAACAGPVTGLCTSITFAGPDLCTVHLGSLLGRSLPTFRAPVPGLIRHYQG